MSKQQGEVGKEETQQRSVGRKRTGPWELWTSWTPLNGKTNWWRRRSYATKELAEQAQAKYTRETFWCSGPSEIRYNDKRKPRKHK